jgi:hypothetical protein
MENVGSVCANARVFRQKRQDTVARLDDDHVVVGSH